MGGECCSAISCSNSRKKRPGLSFFKFPKDSERCKLWVINSGRQDLLNKDNSYLHQNFSFCADHFEVDQCMNPKKNKLIWNAVPTLFNLSKRASVSARWLLHKKSQIHKVHMLRSNTKIVSKKPNNTNAKSWHNLDHCKRCLYVYCRNNSRKENRAFMERIFFLPVPSAETDLKKRKLWLKACGRFDLSKDRSMDRNYYYVCSVHFEGGNGPTTDHPNPIPHKVVQKFSKTDGSVIRVLKSHHVPVLLSRTDTNRIISEQVDCSQPSFESFPEQRNHQGNTGVSPHYEITVRELPTFPPEVYSLNDIRANYSVPYDWTMCITISSIFFAKIQEVTNCLVVQFTIKKDMSTKLQALCKDLDSTHPLLETFPNVISDSKSLDTCFSLLRCWKPCKGNNERAYVSLFSQRNISGFTCPQTNSVHSQSCMLLTNAKSSRCKMCQLQRTSLRAVLKRFMRIHEQIQNDEIIPEDGEYEVIESIDGLLQ